MFVPLSKLLDLALEPLAWALALALAGLALRRRPRAAAGAAALGVVLLLVASAPWTANALARAAERGAVSTLREDLVYDAVVVLGGGMDLPATWATGRPEWSDGVDRVLRGFELARAGRARVAFVSGGSISDDPAEPNEGTLVPPILAAWGLEPSRVLGEARSRNTRENAVETARVVRERGWRKILLVTSAAHLPRALGCFRAVGLEPDALPVDFRAGREGVTFARLLPRASALAQTTTMLRELAGRVVYRVAGWTR